MERKCGYKIIAFIDGQRKVIECSKEEGCLSKLVWSGIGVKAAAEIASDLPVNSVTDAYVEGYCSKVKPD